MKAFRWTKRTKWTKWTVKDEVMMGTMLVLPPITPSSLLRALCALRIFVAFFLFFPLCPNYPT